MNKQLWNIRIWKTGTDSILEVLPWTAVVVDDMPNFSDTYEDNDDDPRSMVSHLSWNHNLEMDKYKSFQLWVVESTNPEEVRRQTSKRKKPAQCMAEMKRGDDTRYLNYVYLEEIKYMNLDFIDPGLVEAKAIIDYRSMTRIPVMVEGKIIEPEEE